MEFKNITKIIGPGGKEVSKITRASDGVILWQPSGTGIIDNQGYWVAPSNIVYYTVSTSTATTTEHTPMAVDTTASSIYTYKTIIYYGNSSTIMFFPTDQYKGKTIHIDYIMANQASITGGVTIQISYASNTTSSIADSWRNDVAHFSGAYQIGKNKLTSNIEFTLSPTYTPSSTINQKYIGVCFKTNSVSGTTTDGRVTFGINNMYTK